MRTSLDNIKIVVVVSKTTLKLVSGNGNTAQLFTSQHNISRGFPCGNLDSTQWLLDADPKSTASTFLMSIFRNPPQRNSTI